MIHSETMRQRLAEISGLFRAIPRALAFYQGSPVMALQRAFRIWRREGIGGIRRRAGILLGGLASGGASRFTGFDLYGDIPAANPGFSPKVSVIVPNYNHAPYLRQRLESIYRQTYRNFEVILLDDCSSDDSAEVLLEFSRRYPEQTLCKFNDANSGSVFRQWKAGFEIATGELVWIAESDDFCSDNFLAEQVSAFQNPAVMLSFCNTVFVKGDPAAEVWTLNEYLAELNIADWNRPFLGSAHALVCSGWAVKNIVPNVSAALFRHPRGLPLLEDPRWLNLRMCGDWIFYLSIVRGGLLAYTPRATNFYRQHDGSTSQSAQKADLYYAEHEVVASFLTGLFRLDRSILDKQDRALYHHWCCHRGSSRRAEFRRLYDPDRVWGKAEYRHPNVVMAVYALTAGGGETFPILLANLLHERGYAVTLLNCLERPTEPGVLNMLSPRIPRLELPRLDLAGAALADMGIELVHSHHAWVDLTLANLLIANKAIKQVVTMHGMYEMMSPSQLDAVLPLLTLRIDQFVFTADKNVACFTESFRRLKNFSKISNALPAMPVNPVDRNSMHIGADDFVLCLVARAIPEKGWAEAIQAVNMANLRSERRIHLLLIGDGPEFDRLSDAERSDRVHFLGFRQNIRDYFAVCDMGFLPSRFKGESAPLVLIDCLLAGKPVLASELGEVRQMLESKDGLAGYLFQVMDWEIDVGALAGIIVRLSDDRSLYEALHARVACAAEKYDASKMIDRYEEVYRRVL
ncbi:glycosyltransferase [Uliginosibacterium sp. 31-16]|uniref:glycosyltransferase n=1 Tax=Uliginosibacterium sp. 31-16 TaxID=3068315 RepID=UPI00273FD9C7|nr:glycosyltransferase [Uliginosibacterium sp. 31-16]MDP5238450.1 glycosyltransferase [Uliginosibacterium sp. 31-16]